MTGVSLKQLSVFGFRVRVCLCVVAMALLAAANPAVAAKPEPAAAKGELTIPLEEAMKPWTGDLDAMIERKVIRVLVVYSKTFYFLDKGAQRGATYDTFRVFEDELNKSLAKEGKLKNKYIKAKVVFIPVGRDELLPALAAGKGDIAAANLTITDARKQLVDFSAPVYPDVSEVVVSSPGAAPLASVNDLAGKTVFVRKSSSYHESLLALNQTLTKAKKSPVVIKLAPESLEDEDLIEMVNAGLIPLIIVDKHKADFWKQVFPNINVNAAAAVRSGATVAWAMRKGSPQLKAALDGFLSRHGQGTAMRNTILNRYLKSAKYVKDAASEAERKKFFALKGFFEKYGEKYDVDWLLMAAQGYQESQLNQAAKSRVGAIGVMQVMPATGKDLAVGDIRQTEPNVHAGIKYMRWMIDNYYGDQPMSQLDKALFSFASYNAGAGRISQLRKEAEKRGLNPNVWFHNVEYVAADKIGAETVTYVGNIYKYYIAYQLVEEARLERKAALEQVKDQAPAAQ
ncbi:lytic transglycosylase F [Niveibacterium sp. 24ML]|uniref:transglycosylase SLT domain-containing protein n=1 Tax=Niveibacterium sp. 24ML TaxID=2985512 RepID=UPI00226ED12C|nr:lytic transglycosylase F [Niveibacterium sp. 24ML]MCX9157852.1 lytic transglycosylase F [Niveibacterium sp. 24ML]